MFELSNGPLALNKPGITGLPTAIAISTFLDTTPRGNVTTQVGAVTSVKRMKPGP